MFQQATEHECHNRFGELQLSQCGTPSQITSSQTRSQAETRRQETHQPHVTLDSVPHWWVPARTPTVHQCLYGGWPWVVQDSLHATTTTTTRPRLSRHALVTNTFCLSVSSSFIHCQCSFALSFFLSRCSLGHVPDAFLLSRCSFF